MWSAEEGSLPCRDIHILISGACEYVTLYVRKDLTGVISFRIRRQDHPGPVDVPGTVTEVHRGRPKIRGAGNAAWKQELLSALGTCMAFRTWKRKGNRFSRKSAPWSSPLGIFILGLKSFWMHTPQKFNWINLYCRKAMIMLLCFSSNKTAQIPGKWIATVSCCHLSWFHAAFMSKACLT